jgi:phospholipase C
LSPDEPPTWQHPDASII